MMPMSLFVALELPTPKPIKPLQYNFFLLCKGSIGDFNKMGTVEFDHGSPLGRWRGETASIPKLKKVPISS